MSSRGGEETSHGCCSVGVAAPANLMESQVGPDPVSTWMGSQSHEVPKGPRQRKGHRFSTLALDTRVLRPPGAKQGLRGALPIAEAGADPSWHRSLGEPHMTDHKEGQRIPAGGVSSCCCCSCSCWEGDLATFSQKLLPL